VGGELQREAFDLKALAEIVREALPFNIAVEIEMIVEVEA
jgi:hypothetical protein